MIMKTEKSEELLKDLQQKKFLPIYLLQGEENFFIDEVSDYIEKYALTESEKSFNQTILYGKDIDADTIVATARRYPMMADRQVVIIKEAQNLKDISQLLSYCERPTPSTVLVLSHKYKTIASNTKLFKAIEAKGAVLVSNKLYENQVPAWIQRYLKQHNYRIEPDAVSLLVEHLGNDLSKIANELSKLQLNISAGSLISMQQITDHIGISKEYNLFEFQKALAQKQVTRVFTIAQHFADNQRNTPLIMVIGSLYRFYSRLYVYMHLKNRPEADILKAMDLRNSYALQDYKEAAGKYSLSQVKKSVDVLHQYDLKSKGVDNLAPPEALMMEMTYRLLTGE